MKAIRKNSTKTWLMLAMAVVISMGTLAASQDGEAGTYGTEGLPQKTHAFSQQELDQMLAPIALYPDPLLSQILMASTYPLEVVEAARWSREHPEQSGDAAVRLVLQRDWDPSVKSLVAFPRVLMAMDEHLEWTENLGEAFLADQPGVMQTIQNLRRKAYDQGYLQPNDRVRVENEGQIIIIEPASPDIIYVPYYDPMVVYGTWWWPDYPPFYWAPWPGYVITSGFGWGGGIVVISGFFIGDCDWREHRVRIVNVNNYYYFRQTHRDEAERHASPSPGFWRHDPVHRRGAQYRDLRLRAEYGHAGTATAPRRKFPGAQPPPANLAVPRQQSPVVQPAPRTFQSSGGVSGNATVPPVRQAVPASPLPSPAQSARPAEHEKHEREDQGRQGRETRARDARPHEEESSGGNVRNQGTNTEQKRYDR